MDNNLPEIFELLTKLKERHPGEPLIKIIEAALKFKNPWRNHYIVNYTDNSMLMALKLYYEKANK